MPDQNPPELACAPHHMCRYHGTCSNPDCEAAQQCLNQIPVSEFKPPNDPADEPAPEQSKPEGGYADIPFEAIRGFANNFPPVVDQELFMALRKVVMHPRFKHLEAWMVWSTMLNMMAGSMYQSSKQLQNFKDAQMFRQVAPAAVSMHLGKVMIEVETRELNEKLKGALPTIKRKLQ